jgi:thiamine pyrophosphokinase
MYKVTCKNKEIIELEKDFNDLTEAMKWAKELGKFVTISGNGMEIVGKFGVDAIEKGLCPDGIPYTWRKRRN